MRFAWLALVLFATPAAAAPSAGKLLTLEADLDGDGKAETITLDKDGTLMAGLGEIKPAYDEADGPAHTKLEIVSLGGKRKGIYLTTEREEGEDPPDRHQVFVYKPGSLARAYNEVHDDHIKWSKLGTGRYVEAGWAACEPASQKAKKPVTRAPTQILTLKLDAKGTKLVTARKNGPDIVKCDELAACPFVYEVVGGEPVLIGEILRNVRHESALQALSLGNGGRTTIRLAEEKPEITFVDEIYLEVDGQRIKPKACAHVTLPYCEADGMSTAMMQGDSLELEFEAPHGVRHLWARGYYNPIPAD
jgi:hypothetical protein